MDTRNSVKIALLAPEGFEEAVELSELARVLAEAGIAVEIFDLHKRRRRAVRHPGKSVAIGVNKRVDQEANRADSAKSDGTGGFMPDEARSSTPA